MKGGKENLKRYQIIITDRLVFCNEVCAVKREYKIEREFLTWNHVCNLESPFDYIPLNLRVCMKDFDVYRINGRLDSLINKVENSPILKKNKDIILKFYDYALSIGLSKLRISTYLIILPQFSEWLDIPFTEASKENIRKLVRKIEQGNYTEFTKNQYKAIIKRFYKWLNGDEEYPKKVKRIKTSCRKTKRKLPEDLITKKELEKMIDSADHIRDKALVSLTYESGFRIGEVLTLRIKHIVFDEYGAKVLVGEGKTGMRRIQNSLLSSVSG